MAVFGDTEGIPVSVMLLNDWFSLSDVQSKVNSHGGEENSEDDDADYHSHHRAAVVALR